MDMYWTGAHTKHRHMYHIVWIPKYRKRILRGEIAERIEALLRECAMMNKWEIHELNIPNSESCAYARAAEAKCKCK